MLKVVSWPWNFGSKQIWNRSFKVSKLIMAFFLKPSMENHILVAVWQSNALKGAYVVNVKKTQ